MTKQADSPEWFDKEDTYVKIGHALVAIGLAFLIGINCGLALLKQMDMEECYNKQGEWSWIHGCEVKERNLYEQ